MTKQACGERLCTRCDDKEQEIRSLKDQESQTSTARVSKGLFE